MSLRNSGRIDKSKVTVKDIYHVIQVNAVLLNYTFIKPWSFIFKDSLRTKSMISEGSSDPEDRSTG